MRSKPKLVCRCFFLVFLMGFNPAAGSRLPYLLQTNHIGLVRDKNQDKEEVLPRPGLATKAFPGYLDQPAYLDLGSPGCFDSLMRPEAQLHTLANKLAELTHFIFPGRAMPLRALSGHDKIGQPCQLTTCFIHRQEIT